MRRLLFAALAVAAFSLPASAADEWFAARVSVSHGGGASSHGSGTPVHCEGGRTLILTNAHVVPAGTTDPITVTIASKTYPARHVEGSAVTHTGPSLIHVDGPDLALLEVDADLGAVTIAEQLPAVGESVFQWGFGGANEPRLKYGEVQSSIFVDQLVSSIPSQQGDSGSGVFNEAGCLCGVTHGGTGAQSLAVTTTTVRIFLKRPRLAELFPRLAAKLAANRAAHAVAADEVKIPAPKPKEVKVPMPKSKESPKPKDSLPAKPAICTGDGWQYNAATGQWWRTVTGPTPAPSLGGCPGGVCPAPSAPRRGLFR